MLRLELLRICIHIQQGADTEEDTCTSPVPEKSKRSTNKQDQSNRMTIVENEPQEIPSEEAPVEEAPVEEAPVDVEAAEKPAEETECVHAKVKIEEPAEASVAKTARSADWSRNRRASIKAIMKKKKLKDEIPLGENIYSLLIVSPTFSWPFIFVVGVYAIKISILAILLSDINLNDNANHDEDPKVTVVKFCLIPVAVAMQEDMMYSFFFYANVIYCPKIMDVAECATKGRFYFSYLLRTIDGILSLFSNYFIMLITPVTLDVFLNFAALQFLYDIDDVFYELVTQGFFGDNLESYAKICEDITMERRFGNDNTKILRFFRVSWLDSILFSVSLLICYIIFAIVTTSQYTDSTLFIGTASPTVSAMPSAAPTDFPSMLPSLLLAAFNETDDAIATDDGI